MFGGVQIGVGFQPELQLTFHCIAVSIKPWFMVVSIFATPSRRLVTKSRFCCSTHTLLQQGG